MEPTKLNQVALVSQVSVTGASNHSQLLRGKITDILQMEQVEPQRSH